MSEHEIVHDTAPNPMFSVIWMHGLGADGSDFVPLIPELRLPPGTAMRFIFPHAPHIPVTWNGGHVMPAWYDIVSVDDEKRHADVAGVAKSRERIRALIAAENARGVPSERIVLAGFSQGGAMAYTVGLTHPQSLAGILALSTYIPVPELVGAEWQDAQRTTPIFAAHGTQDNVVPLTLGERARDMIVEAGFALEWHTYPMAHSLCAEEVGAISAWLQARLAAEPR
ncbi:dienelactone hydrolase family protein [Robbsia sp. Bb-Pol-6]|uniref:Dienelactone hydrolase family protein n=1 Tax=Robbsia betulipollinis TaxID=2981849 RepID=A0ABT3ZNQ7_9BURK|nr:dienelactone hydrolase family protein [Robbsia betulipollinis]MCY0388178.1 dienelactone hydrolase family protein [Robbsia betulipollinis]